MLDLIHKFFETVYNVPELIRIGGLLGIVLIVFAETGLMIGFFLPGDSLLVTAGLFAARGDLDIVWLNVLVIAAAIIGDAVGYYIGRHAGEALYSRPNSLLFRREHLSGRTSSTSATAARRSSSRGSCRSSARLRQSWPARRR